MPLASTPSGPFTQIGHDRGNPGNVFYAQPPRPSGIRRPSPRKSALPSTSPTKYLQPPNTNPRNRSVSLPDASASKSNSSSQRTRDGPMPPSPSGIPTRPPRSSARVGYAGTGLGLGMPTQLQTPSKLPRPGISGVTANQPAGRTSHAQSVSLSLPRPLASPTKANQGQRHRASASGSMVPPPTLYSARSPKPSRTSQIQRFSDPTPPPLPASGRAAPPTPSTDTPLRISVDMPHSQGTSSPRMAPAPAIPPRKYIKREPLIVLAELTALLSPFEAERLREWFPVDVLMAVHEREVMEREMMLMDGLQRVKSVKKHTVVPQSDGMGKPGVFGVPLRQLSLYASTKTVLGGCEHDLPIVVFACVEELYRSGISPSTNPSNTMFSSISSRTLSSTRRTLSSFLSSPSSPSPKPLPDPNRLETLISLFDSSQTHYGLDLALKDEQSTDVYTLLTYFLQRLSHNEAVIAPAEMLRGVREALWAWCIKPGLEARNADASPSLSDSKHNVELTSDPKPRIRIAQTLLRLLPTAHLSLFVYLVAFACQVLEVRVRMLTQSLSAAGTDVLPIPGSESNAELAGTGTESSIEAQILALERELAVGSGSELDETGDEDRREKARERELELEKKERERARTRLGKVFGKWIFGPDVEGVEPGGNADRSTELMVWFVSNWREIIRGLFAAESGDTLKSTLKEVTSIRSQPESGVTSVSGVDGVRMGLVRGLSYGKATPGLVPPETECHGSIHSRMSSEIGVEDATADDSARTPRPQDSLEMKRKTDGSGSGDGSDNDALMERLLRVDSASDSDSDLPSPHKSDLPYLPALQLPHAASGARLSQGEFLIRDESASDLLTESAGQSISLGHSSLNMKEGYAPGCDSEKPLKVVNLMTPAHSQCRSECSDSGSEYSSCSQYSESESTSASDGSNARRPFSATHNVLMMPLPVEASSIELGVEPSRVVEVHVERDKTVDQLLPAVPLPIRKAKHLCTQCADNCPAHVYVRTLQQRVTELVELLKKQEIRSDSLSRDGPRVDIELP